MPDEAALLIADVYEAAGALRRLGERPPARKDSPRHGGRC